MRLIDITSYLIFNNFFNNLDLKLKDNLPNVYLSIYNTLAKKDKYNLLISVNNDKIKLEFNTIIRNFNIILNE